MKRIITAFSLAAAFVSLAQSIDKEVRIVNPSDGVALAGTLTLPVDNSPKAVIIFASGSGCQDRMRLFSAKSHSRLLQTALRPMGMRRSDMMTEVRGNPMEISRGPPQEHFFPI